MYSSDNLTSRQAELLEFLFQFRNKQRVSPTYREIANHFGFKSPKAAIDHIRALERKGFVYIHAGRSRGIEIIASPPSALAETVSVPVVGNIPAGQPELKSESPSGNLMVDPAMLGGVARHRLFALQVRGDSMGDRGIYDGDWVVADAEAVPRENDVVVALIDGENTLKTLAKQKQRFYLKAESPKHPDWIPITELIIQGVVKTLLRQMT